MVSRIQTTVIAEAGLMLDELEEFFLRVELLPAPEPMHVGHMVRTVTNQNPEWYKYAWRTLGSSSRQRIKGALRRIENRTTRDGASDNVLLEIAVRRVNDEEPDAHGMLRSEREQSERLPF